MQNELTVRSHGETLFIVRVKVYFPSRVKLQGKEERAPFGYGAEKGVRMFLEGNDIIMTIFSCCSACLGVMCLTVRETFTPQSPTQAYL